MQKEIGMAKDLFEWDTEKDAKNKKKHGISFDEAELFDFSTALIVEDTRMDYGEDRYNAFGFDTLGKFRCMTFTPRGEKIRVISYREGAKQELRVFLSQHGGTYEHT